MRVRFSADARRDIEDQITYLRGKTNSGIVRFRDLVQRGAALLQDRPHAGFTESRIPIRGARRIIVDGWYFDYDVVADTIWVHRITSSVNTPSLDYDDDGDYEEPSSGSHEPRE